MSFKCADVQDQYAKNKDLKREDIVLLKEWLQKQPHLPPITEIELILFHHHSYFRTERTKLAIENYFTLRTLSPEFFGSKDPNEFQTALNQAVYAFLPKLTPDGYLICYVKLFNCNPNEFIFGTHIKYGDMSFKMHLLENGVVEGVVLIVDLKGFTFEYLTKMPLSELRKIFQYLQVTPLRLKAIHCINSFVFLDKLITLVKPLMKAELFKLVHFHTDNLEKLYQYVPQELLPKDFGGSVDSIADLQDATKKQMIKHAEFMTQEEGRVVDDSKRQGECRNVDALFGIDGSFKKLEVD